MPCDEGEMSEIRLPKKCVLFKPGHNPHWIQVSQASKDVQSPPVPARVIDIRDDGTVRLQIAQRELCFWNHDVGRLLDALEIGGEGLTYQSRWRLIHVPHGQDSYVFCVGSSLNNRLHCLPDTPGVALKELLDLVGGFTLGEDSERLRDFRNAH
jgi:hypothetical protein